MISSAALFAFLATSVVLIAIPGPSVMFIIGRTLADGKRAGLITVIFNSFGHTTWMLAVAFGLGEALKLYPAALEIVKYGGAIYLGYLGVQTFRQRASKAAIETRAATKVSFGKLAKEGFIVGFSNPKVAVFFMAVLPQFVEPGDNFTLQFLLLGVLFEIMGITGDAIYALMAGAARNWIFAKTKRLEQITATGGLLIVTLALVLLATSLVESFS